MSSRQASSISSSSTSAIAAAPPQTWIEIVTQDPATARTTYTYDRLGRLTDVSDASSTITHNVTHMNYDLAGHKVLMSDPDMGSWSYAYDATGNLKTQTDARLAKTTLQYDSTQRLTAKSYTAAGGAVTTSTVLYHYDQYVEPSLCPANISPDSTKIGHLTWDTDAGGAGEQCYDVRGREVSARRSIDGVNYDVQTRYDPLGQALSVQYPDLESVTYAENQQGELTSMTAGSTTLLSAATLTPWGAPTSIALGNGYSTNTTYDARARAKEIKTTDQTHVVSVEDLALSFDDAGNVTGSNDLVAGENAGYTYDQLDRVTAMWVNGAQISAYTYNQIGNMTYKAEVGNGNYFLYYPATGQTQPHATTSAWNIGVAYTFTAYDANGNMLSETGPSNNAFTYDVENRLASRTMDGGATMSYVYDGGGHLVKRTNSADGSGTVYIGGVYEKKTAGANVTTTKYYSAFGRTIAMRTVTSSTNDVSYILSDQLGSTTQTVTNGVVATQKYYPYGATRGTPGALPTDKLFTGQQQEPGDALGLYNYKARFYSTTLGRFVSADTSAADGLNRYSYVRDNPIKYNDPSGHGTDCTAFGDCSCSKACHDELQHRQTQYQNAQHFVVGAIARGYVFLPAAFGTAYLGDSEGLYALGTRNLTLSLGGATITLLAGTYLMKFDRTSVLDGTFDFEHPGGHAVPIVNGGTAVVVDGYNMTASQAMAYLTAAYQNVYNHYTTDAGAAGILASQALTSEKGKTYFTKEAYGSGTEARDRLFMDKTPTVAVVFAATEPYDGYGPVLNGEGQPTGGHEYIAGSPYPIFPILAVRLAP